MSMLSETTVINIFKKLAFVKSTGMCEDQYSCLHDIQTN